MEAFAEQRKQIREDLAFSDPSNPDQWDAEEKRQRETDPGGARPCLVMDQCGQYVANVAGQVEQRPPAMHALPVDSQADKKVAEQLDGFYRHVEHASRAHQHYARALTSAARTGVGYLILRPEYVDRALNYQEPRISSEGDPLRVVLDPFSQEIDGSDAESAWLLTPVSHTAFERQWGKKKNKINYGDKDQVIVKDERKEVLVAEQWLVSDESQTVIVCKDSEGAEVSLPEDEYRLAAESGRQLERLREYRDKVRTVKWCRMSGADVLTEERVYPASGVGIVPVYGYVSWTDGRLRYCGIPRRAMEPQRAYNYHVSEIRALMTQAPRSPWTAPVRALKGLEEIWDKASVEARAVLPYHDVDELGPIAAPQRSQVSQNLANHIGGAQQALRDVEASIGMFAANLGRPSNETSGVAIDARKEQGEASTAHFPAHLAASITQAGRLVLDMIPRLIDTKRQMRILGIDNTPSSVTIDPQQPQAVQEVEGGISINPHLGRYDVRVTVGASFTTQRAQAQEAFSGMMRANPDMMPAVAPFWAATLDIPNRDKFHEVMIAIAPEPVRAILQPNAELTTGDLTAKLEEMKAALQEAIQHAEDAQRDADKAQEEARSKVAETEAKRRELEIKEYDAETKRLQVTGANEEQIKAVTADLMASILEQVQPPMGGEEAEPDEQQAMTQAVAQALMPVAEGQAQVEALLGQLIRLVQAERERIPERGKDGSITRVIDRLAQMPSEGPMQ
jgi:hypothetical protein